MAPIAIDENHIGVQPVPGEAAPAGVSLAIGVIVIDEARGRGIPSREGFGIAGDGRTQILSRLFTQLRAPPAVGVDPPDGALHEGDMLVGHDELAEDQRRGLGGHG